MTRQSNAVFYQTHVIKSFVDWKQMIWLLNYNMIFFMIQSEDLLNLGLIARLISYVYFSF